MFLATFACGLLAAQDRATLPVREDELARCAVAELHRIADALQAEKQHLRALELRREIWMDYDGDDERARRRTGFVKVGSLWRRDPDALLLDRNLKGKASRIRRIDRDWQKVARQLVTEHRALAEAWTRLGEPQRAAKHWRRVLRFRPGDRAATEALAIREFEGFAGTAHELRMLRRGRAIHLACDWLRRTQFPVQELTGRRLPLLEAAGLPHQGVQSEFFKVWGTLPVESLTTIAMDCERALLLVQTLLGVSTGEVFHPKRIRNLVFVGGQGEYAAVIDVCKSQFTPDRLAFLRDVVDMCFLQHGGESLRVHKSDLGMDVCRDIAVRGVVQDALGVDTEGLWEGVGHMACGFLFGRSLTFLQEQLHERTSAGHTPTRLAPDLEVWMQIAQESAWAKSDTRTSELVLLKAAKFTSEQRVKAWAICHYLAHWRPELILELDACAIEGVRTPPDVEAEFLRRVGYALPKIDQDWRTFWSRGAELRAAMVRDPLPNQKSKQRKAIERSRALVDALNAARAAARVGPVGYYLDASPDFFAVRRYEKELARARKEQAKRDRLAKKGRKVEPVEFPALPPAVGVTVLWSPLDTPAEAVRSWFADPRQRDRLLAPGRDLVAVPSDAGGFLLGIAMPAASTVRGDPLAWPRDGQTDVPALPPSLHFAREMKPAELQQVGCQVFAGNLPVDGELVHHPDLGCVAFVPQKPLPGGQRIEVRWLVPQALLGDDRRFGTVTYTTR